MQGNILDTIKAETIEDMYIAVTQLAAEWAVAGYIHQSNGLLEALWSFKLPHTKNLWSLDQGFQFLWHEAQQYPKNIPFALEDLAKIEKQNFYEFFYPYKWLPTLVQKFEDRPWQQLKGNDLLIKATLLSYDATAEDHFSSRDRQLEALAAMEKFVEGTLIGSNIYNPLNFIIILSLKNNLPGKALYYLTKWCEDYKQSFSFLSLSNLMRNRSVVKLLLTKHLAPTFGLTDYNFAYAEMEITAAIRERITNGRTLIYGNLSWKELLQEISTIAIEKDDWLFEEDIKQSGWLGINPATPEEIEQNEKRLGIILPKEYKEFMLTTNGFIAPSSIGITMAPVHKIDWLINVDDSLIDWYDAISDDEEYQQLSKKFKKALFVGGFSEEQHLFLIPNDTTEDWECWFFAFWSPGETIYPNLRFYFEYKLQFLKTAPY